MTYSYLNTLTDELAKINHAHDVAVSDGDLPRAAALLGDADKIAERIARQRKAMGDAE